MLIAFIFIRCRVSGVRCQVSGGLPQPSLVINWSLSTVQCPLLERFEALDREYRELKIVKGVKYSRQGTLVSQSTL